MVKAQSNDLGLEYERDFAAISAKLTTADQQLVAAETKVGLMNLDGDLDAIKAEGSPPKISILIQRQTRRKSRSERIGVFSKGIS